MTMITEPVSSVSTWEGLVPTSTGGRWASSGIDPDLQRTDRLSELDAGLLPLRHDEIVDHDTTPRTKVTRSFNFGCSSSVFASDGLVRTTPQAYSARISALRRFAAQDDEYELNPASEFDFWCFVRSEPRWRKGSLVLMDNGNLRAVWKDSQGSHLGLQFLGSEAVQYVIFRQRAVMRPISRVAGRDTFAGLKRQIDAFELDSLLCE